MTRVLVVCHDVVGREMAGPGIRSWEMSAALSRRGHDVTLAAPVGSDFPEAVFQMLSYAIGSPELIAAARDIDAIVVTGPILEQFQDLKALDLPIVVDLYDPFLFENMHRLGDTAAGWAEHRGGAHTLLEQVFRGDFFICANERQRDLYMGLLTAAGRVNPSTHGADATLENLLAVVPFGLPNQPPIRAAGIREAITGLGSRGPVVVWNGGIWDWFDADTAIRAIARLREELPDLRLVFLGTKHPNPAIGEPGSAARAKKLATELGLLGECVFFRDWTPYSERGAWLLEADAAISLHVAGVETRYASRTRFLDCIWAGVPVVATDGDAIGDDLRARGLAFSAPPGDVVAVTDALRALLVEPTGQVSRDAEFVSLRAELTWDKVVAPLAAFCSAPHRAADRLGTAVNPPDEGLLRRLLGRLRGG